MEIFFSLCCRPYNPLVNLIHLLREIYLKLRISLLKPDDPLHVFLRCEKWFMYAGEAFSSSNNWVIYCLELKNHSLLNRQDVSPGISPCLCGLNQLPRVLVRQRFFRGQNVPWPTFSLHLRIHSVAPLLATHLQTEGVASRSASACSAWWRIPLAVMNCLGL